jgi:hypothetical protein
MNNNEITLFISNKKMNYYDKPYQKDFIYYLHLEELNVIESFGTIYNITSKVKVINIILLAKVIDVRPYKLDFLNYRLDRMISVLVLLNCNATFRFLVGCDHGLYMHEHIFALPPGSCIITLSDYNNHTYYSALLYTLTQQFKTISLILNNYILLFTNKLYTPSIYISSFERQGQIISLFSKMKSEYYLDLYPTLLDPSIKQMSEIFLTDGLTTSTIEEQRLLWVECTKAYLNKIKEQPKDDFLKIYKSALDENTLKGLRNYNRKHPLQITKDLNSLFQEDKIEVCEQKIKVYFDTLYKDYKYIDLFYPLTSTMIHTMVLPRTFYLKLRIYNEPSKGNVS